MFSLQIMHKHCPYLLGPIESLRDLVSPETDIKVKVFFQMRQVNIIHSVSTLLQVDLYPSC